MTTDSLDPRNRAPDDRREAGASLMEYLLWAALGVAGLIGAGMLFTQGDAANKQTEAMQQVSGLSAGVHRLFSGHSNYGTAELSAALISAGVVPANMINSAGNGMVNIYGGTTTVTPSTQTFAIAFQNVPQQHCVNLLTMTTRGNSIISVAAGSSSFLQSQLPVTLASANTACGSADTTTVMTWTFQ